MSYLLFFLWADSILNFDYLQTSGTVFYLFGTRVRHNFPPLLTFFSGLESSHNKLGTNLDCFLTFWDGMTAHQPLFNPNFTIFGVKCPFFNGWHRLFFLPIAFLLDFSPPLETYDWVFGGQCPFFHVSHLLFFSLSRFVIKFWLFLTIWDHFLPLWNQSWA